MILSSLASRSKRTGKSIKTDYAIVLTVANGQIVCFQDDQMSLDGRASDC